MTVSKHSLLPPDALEGKALGISVSESADLQQLGLFEDHFRLALGDIARTTLFAGGNLYYGGHLRADGYTQFLIDELQRYGNRNRPFKICLAYSEHQKMSSDDIAQQKERLGLFGEIVFLNEDGNPSQFSENSDPTSYEPTQKVLEKSLTDLRIYLAQSTDARIVLGGKRTGFLGRYPGILEEVIVSVNAGKPLFLAGGFGGATLDAISVLSPEHASWFERYADEGGDHGKLVSGLDALSDAAAKTDGWNANGLAPAQNALLAATYRSSEIAALVGHGLGKIGG